MMPSSESESTVARPGPRRRPGAAAGPEIIMISDIITWYPISDPISCTISYRLDFFHPWIRKLQALSQAVKLF